MAVEEQNLASSSAGMELQERQTVANPAELLQKSLSGLDKFGGFQLLKGLIKVLRIWILVEKPSRMFS